MLVQVQRNSLLPRVREPFFQQRGKGYAVDGLVQPLIDKAFPEQVAWQKVGFFGKVKRRIRMQGAQLRLEFLLQARFDGIGN